MTRENARAPAPDDAGLVRHFAHAAQAILENARELRDEAVLLGRSNHRSRAVALHQISLEECAKIDMLGAAATSVLMREPVDTVRLYRAMSQHRVKNATNAYMLPADAAERDAQAAGAWSDAQAVFAERKRAFQQDSNAAKNNALYVDVRADRVIAPKDSITEDMKVAFQLRNDEYLGRAEVMSRMLASWAEDPEPAIRMLSDFTKVAESIRSVANPTEMMQTLIDHIKSRAEDSGYAAQARRRRKDE